MNQEKHGNDIQTDQKWIFLYCPYLSSIHEKANLSRYFGLDVRTHLGVAFS